MKKRFFKILIFAAIVGIVVIIAYLYQRSQKSYLRPMIQAVVDTMQTSSYQGSNLNMMGREPIPSRQFSRFIFLCDSATIPELILLTDHQSAVVRSYAFDALSQRNLPNYIELLQSHMNDTAKFQTHYFDMIGHSSVAEHIKNISLNNYHEYCEPNDQSYSFIRNLAATQETPNAVIALARYRKQNDAKIISQYLAINQARLHRYGLRVAREFPSETIYDSLVQLYKLEINYNPPLLFCFPLYQALARYNKQTSYDLLSEALLKPDKYHMRKIAVYVALTKYPDKYFESILKNIILSDYDKNLLEEYKYYYQ